MEKTEFYFYKVNQSTGRRQTIAGLVQDNTLRIGVSECSFKDQFNKKKGRSIAMGRAKSKHAVVINIDADTKPIQQFINTVNQ